MALTAPRRPGTVLWGIGDLIDRHADELAELETRDQGQPIGISRNVSVVAAAEHFRYYAGWVTKIAGETNPLSFPGTFNYTVREPVGVCGLIVPWNFPLMITAWKLAPALACGNTCVVKPAEQTPLTALRLAELIAEAGVPDGVVNVVTGGPVVGAAIAEHRAHRQGVVHGIDRGWQVDRACCRRQLQARVARARGQESRHRLRRRAAGRGRRRRPAGWAAEQRTGMRGLQPRVRPPIDRGSVRRGCCRCGLVDAARPWPACRDAARPARLARSPRKRRGIHPDWHRRGRAAGLRRQAPRVAIWRQAHS